MPTVTQRALLRERAGDHMQDADKYRGQAHQDLMASKAVAVALMAVSHEIRALTLEIRAGAER